LARLATIGVVPGQDFDLGKLDPAVAKGLENSVKVALEQLQAARASGHISGQIW
jgi:hypothetical protein